MSHTSYTPVGNNIAPARTVADLKITQQLFKEYAESLGIDLGFQSFNDELSDLPGRYAPPSGEILLAFNSDGEPIGCVALRALSPPGYCEMKRLYVLPRGRGSGAGKALVDAIVKEAERIGYTHVRLDTLSSMVAAQTLYREAGFEETTAYYETPMVGTVFMERRLKPERSKS